MGCGMRGLFNQVIVLGDIFFAKIVVDCFLCRARHPHVFMDIIENKICSHVDKPNGQSRTDISGDHPRDQKRGPAPNCSPTHGFETYLHIYGVGTFTLNDYRSFGGVKTSR